tara:strand:+ start:5552 stop:7180 length:1629 start_codon:yes stop_codon:yes gene_type:complete
MDEKYKQCAEYTAAECPSGIGPLCTGKGMGGHPGAFTDITIKMDDKCITTCGKKLTDETEKEFDFYKALYTEPNIPQHIEKLKKYMPDFFPNEVCEKKWEEKSKGWIWNNMEKKSGVYFPISNIKVGLGDNQKTLDFKIGKKTAFKSDKGSIGRFRHKILDEEMSRSSEIGFRLEGATQVSGMVEKAKQDSEKSGWKDTLIQHEGKKQLQAGLYMLYPEFIWDYFIDNKEEGKKLLIQFKNFESDFIHPNIKAATEHQQSIGFIGSSVLIAKGASDIKFNIIDFAHPFWDIIAKRTIPRKHKEIVLNYCVGLLSFIARYEQWFKAKFGENEETPTQIGSGRSRTRNKRRKRRNKNTRKRKKKTRRRRKKKQHNTRKKGGCWWCCDKKKEKPNDFQQKYEREVTKQFLVSRGYNYNPLKHREGFKKVSEISKKENTLTPLEMVRREDENRQNRIESEFLYSKPAENPMIAINKATELGSYQDAQDDRIAGIRKDGTIGYIDCEGRASPPPLFPNEKSRAVSPHLYKTVSSGDLTSLTRKIKKE